MCPKQVKIVPRPSKAKPSKLEDADAWVKSRTAEKSKRLTIDVPAELHSRLKAACALRGAKMADEIRALLEREYGKS